MQRRDPAAWAALTDEERKQELDVLPEARERVLALIDAFFVAQVTGLRPWEAGREVSRSHFYAAAAILAPAMALTPLNLQRAAFEFEIEKAKSGPRCPLG